MISLGYQNRDIHMAARKFKTHCRIQDYIEAADPEFAEIIRGTCSDMALGSTKGKPGITFLLPQDKSLRKKIADLAYSDKIEDANKAGDMINAMIFRDVFKSTSDWVSKKDDIPNSLFPAQHVEINTASGKEIIFKSGAKAVLDENFKDSSRKSNLAVWLLTTGEIPVTTDKPATLKYAKRPRANGSAKTGAYEMTSERSKSYRSMIALEVEKEYANYRRDLNPFSQTGQKRNVYNEYTINLINYILNVVNDSHLVYDKLLPLISFDVTDFYLLVEPHKFGGDYLISDTLIREWWDQRDKHHCNQQNIAAQIENLLLNGSGCLVYSDRVGVLKAIDEVRTKLQQNILYKPRQCIDEIKKFYNELESENTINGRGPILPPGLHKYYKSEPGLKFIQDEVRYLTYGMFKMSELDPLFDLQRLNNDLNKIAESLFYDQTGNKMPQLLNKAKIEAFINPTHQITEINMFVNSTMFLYIPMTKSEASNLEQKYSVKRPNPENIVIWNMSKDLYIQHNRVLTSANNGAAIKAINNINFNNLDPQTRELLKKQLEQS